MLYIFSFRGSDKNIFPLDYYEGEYAQIKLHAIIFYEDQNQKIFAQT